MNSQRLLIKLVALACLGTVSAAAMADAQEEVDKQISNMISGAVSARVGSALEAPATATKLNNGGYGGITNVQVKGSGFSNVSSNAYLAGVDHNFTKDLIGGAALDYYTLPGGSITGINPYVAYVLNDNLFLVGKLGYASGNIGSNSDMNTSAASVSINALHKAGNLLVKGGLEFGGVRSETNANGMRSTSRMSTTLAEGELGYFFMPDLKGFVGLTLNTTNQANSYSADMAIGLEKEIGKDAAIAFKYGTQVDSDQPSGTNIKVNVYSISARFRF